MIHFPLFPKVFLRGDHLQIPRHVAEMHFLSIQVQLPDSRATARKVFRAFDLREKFVEREVENLVSAFGPVLDLEICFPSWVVGPLQPRFAGQTDGVVDRAQLPLVGADLHTGESFAVDHAALSFALGGRWEYVMPPLPVVAVLLEGLDEAGGHAKRANLRWSFLAAAQ